MRGTIRQHLDTLFQSIILAFGTLVHFFHLFQFILGIALGFGGPTEEGFEFIVLFLEGGIFAEEVLEGGYGCLWELLFDEEVG